MSHSATSATALVRSVLAASGVPARKGSRGPSLKAVPDARGKVIQPDALATRVAREATLAAMRPHQAKLAAAGMGSEERVLAVMADALRRMIGDRTEGITVGTWLGTIFEIEGPKHPYVREHTRLLSDASIEFANDAIAGARAAFIDGRGRVRALAQALNAADLREIHDLRIGGSKYCDRALQITDARGNMFLVLTQEFKTAGNKRSAIDAQQDARNVRLVDEKRSPTVKLRYFQGGERMPDVDLDRVLIHLENTEAQIGVKSGSKNAWDPRTQRLTDGQYTSTYHYLRIDWPSRELRFVLQHVWNGL